MYVWYGTTVVTLRMVPSSPTVGGSAGGKDTVWTPPQPGRCRRGTTRSRTRIGQRAMAPAPPRNTLVVATTMPIKIDALVRSLNSPPPVAQERGHQPNVRK